MLEQQIDKLRTILTDEELQHYAGDSFWKLIQTVITADPFAAISSGKDIKDLVFHLPAVLFWDKMKRYLLGTFLDYEDQVKMASKFNNDNKKYNEFVKRQIQLINQIDDDYKVDYFAALTRSFLLTDLEEDLFFKLSKYIMICTPSELKFLKDLPYNYQGNNNAMVSSLYQYGLFTQTENNGIISYIMSDFCIALKQNGLNFDDGVEGTMIESYKEVAPLSIVEPVTIGSFESSDHQMFMVKKE